MASIAVVIVTHNSEQVIGKCINALQQQSTDDIEICIVDSGSDDSAYLNRFERMPFVKVMRKGNVGFSQANNVGYNSCSSTAQYILFLNPDAFVDPLTLSQARQRMEEHSDVGCCGGRLLGYDIETETPTGRLDSTGIFRKWYGRWCDRGQGEAEIGQFSRVEETPAACGAFMFCRQNALQDILLPGRAVFDPDFFLYKEDIELSLRLREKGWKILYSPEVTVYHCRGWQKQRSQMDISHRENAARNEVLLYRKHPSIYFLWALLKYVCVKGLRV